jgi:hypothetical protein
MGNRQLLATILVVIAAVLLGIGVTTAFKRQPAATVNQETDTTESVELDGTDEIITDDESVVEPDEATADEDLSTEPTDEEDFAPVNEEVGE